MSLPVDHLLATARAFEAGELPSAETRAEFVRIVRRWRAGMSWTDACALSGPLALAERNRALCDAAALLAWGDPTPWELAGRLQERINRFRDRWPRIRAGAAPRDGLDAHLARAFRVNRIPTSRKQLAAILAAGNSRE
jgi:hypothetical protein